MGHHLTKAVGLHVADAVWEPLIRHLFPMRHGADTGGHLAPVVFTGLPGGGSGAAGRGYPKAQGSGRTWRISWPTPPCGTRSTWCGCVIAALRVGGGTKRIC